MNINKTIAVIQARMASSRFPGKVLADLGGKPVLAWVVERVAKAQAVGKVVVATTTESEDDPIAAFCDSRKLSCYRGSQHDVLDRYYQAAKAHQAFIVVRVTADCPLIDPSLIDRTVMFMWGGFSGGTIVPKPWFDFTANRLPPPWTRTYPVGLDVEACTFEALETAWREAAEPHQREHVMPFIYEHEARFKISVVNHDEDLSDRRWTVDTPEDLAALRALVPLLPQEFDWLDVLEIWDAHPEIRALNAGVVHKSGKDVDGRAA
jgi:spore coat polysaccharide biosynthesis protein SpsF